MADRKISELNAADSANLHDSALIHVVDTTEAFAEDQNVKSTIAQVRTAIISDGSVTEAKIGTGAVTNVKVATGLDASKLTTGTLPIARIADGSITNAKLASSLVFYVGVVNSQGGGVVPTGWSSPVRDSAGTYTITHNLNSAAVLVLTTAYQAFDYRVMTYEVTSVNAFKVYCRNSSGTLGDNSFSFMLAFQP
jgi:hypothetical protein